MKYCTHCGEKFSSREKFCLHCGKKRKTSYKTLGVVVIVLLAIFGLLAFLYYLGSTEEYQDANFMEEIMKNFKEEEPVVNNYDVASTVVNVFCPYEGEKVNLDAYGFGGSGTVITNFGYILTNSHIIPQDDDLLDVNEEGCIVVFPDQSTGLPREAYLAYPYVIEDLSDEYDLAILEIYEPYIGKDGESYGFFPKTFTEISDDPCNEEDIRLGEPVKIYGYPGTTGGYSLTVTEGVVSAFSDAGLFTSAKIDSGNSGGLATDQYGCFIGVPTAVRDGDHESYGLIIPYYQVEEFINEFAALLEESE